MVFLQKPAECFLFYSNYKRKWSKIHFFVILYSTSSSSHAGRYLNLQAYWIQKSNLNFIIIKIKLIHYQNNQFYSVAQSCMILWNPMDCNTPGLPVHHQLPELTQARVHWVGDPTFSNFLLSLVSQAELPGGSWSQGLLEAPSSGSLSAETPAYCLTSYLA